AFGGPAGVRPMTTGVPMSTPMAANNMQPAASNFPSGAAPAANPWPMDDGSRRPLTPAPMSGMPMPPNAAPVAPAAPMPPSSPTSWNTTPASPAIVPPPAPVMPGAMAASNLPPAAVP